MIPKDARVYISGPMTGMPDHNFTAFQSAAEDLRKDGYTVFSPHEVLLKRDWLGYMRFDIKALMDCDAVFVLPGWRRSRGAKIEVKLALDLGIPVYVNKRERLIPSYGWGE